MFRLHTLGVVKLERVDGTEVRSVLAQSKRLALLAHLAIAAPGGFVRRDTLLGLFWPELDEAHARSASSQALYYLRRSLGEQTVIARGKDEVGVSREHLWCDAVELADLLTDGSPRAVEEALRLYRGELLPGLHLSEAPAFERWLQEQRGWLCRRTADAAWTLSRRAEAEGRTSEAVKHGRRALAIGGPDERRTRALMEMMARAGDRAGALHLYAEVSERLVREWEIEPSEETRRLAEALKAWPASVSTQPGGVARAAAGGATVPPSADVPPRPAHAPPAPADPQPPRARGPRRPHSLLVAAATLLVLVPAAALLRTDHVPGPAPGGGALSAAALDPHRVAVLPLRNLSPDSADAYVADALTAELIHRLSRLRDLRVLPHTAVAGFAGARDAGLDLGRALDVGTIVEGTAAKLGDDVRMTVQLIAAVDRAVLWSAAYDAKVDELLDVQRRIAEEVALRLRVSLRALAEEKTSTSASRAAHEEYLRGRALLGRTDWSSLLLARDHFRNALAHDSTFAEAWSGLAFAVNQLTKSGVVAGPEAWAEARRAARRALALDDQLPEAHAALGVVRLMSDWDPAGAEQHFRRAIELDPSEVNVRVDYAVLLRNLGRFDEALEQIRNARALDPRQPQPALEEATVLYLAGRIEEAMRRLEQLLPEVGETALQFDGGERFSVPSFWPRFTMALAQAQSGDYEAALVSLDLADPSGGRPDARALRGWIYARMGRAAEARRILAEMDGPSQVQPVSDFHRAVVLVGLGEHARALSLLQRAAEQRAPRLVMLLKVEPKFEPLRADPRFRSLLAELGLATSTS